MNTATILNQPFLQNLIQTETNQHCRKIIESKHFSVVPEMPKNRLFRLTEAPAKPPFLENVLQLLRSHGFNEQDFRIGYTGFGKVKTHLAEIGLVSTTPGFYNLHLGGTRTGNQLNKIYRINVSEATILNELNHLFAAFKITRKPGETFGEFVSRKKLM